MGFAVRHRHRFAGPMPIFQFNGRHVSDGVSEISFEHLKGSFTNAIDIRPIAPGKSTQWRRANVQFSRLEIQRTGTRSGFNNSLDSNLPNDVQYLLSIISTSLITGPFAMGANWTDQVDLGNGFTFTPNEVNSVIGNTVTFAYLTRLRPYPSSHPYSLYSRRHKDDDHDDLWMQLYQMCSIADCLYLPSTTIDAFVDIIARHDAG
ncbi:hypothetical protein EDD85DRAFT_941279 [Armillaria nabsnona]|nr:hypothetical protein EDD85DRAFT_941279 [Armillaria nabsnona]